MWADGASGTSGPRTRCLGTDGIITEHRLRLRVPLARLMADRDRPITRRAADSADVPADLEEADRAVLAAAGPAVWAAAVRAAPAAVLGAVVRVPGVPAALAAVVPAEEAQAEDEKMVFI